MCVYPSASLSAERRAATAEDCRQYAINRGTKAGSRSGAGHRCPLRRQSPATPRALAPARGGRELSAVLKPGPLGAVRGSEAQPVLRRSGAGSPPLAGHREEAVPEGPQRGVRRWEEEEERAGCPRGRGGTLQPPSCPQPCRQSWRRRRS